MAGMFLNPPCLSACLFFPLIMCPSTPQHRWIFYPSASLPLYPSVHGVLCPIASQFSLSLCSYKPPCYLASPPQSEKEKRDEGMSESQKNIDFLHKNTAIYHTRAERTAYLAAVVNNNFVHSVAADQLIYEFITGDKLSTNFVKS